MKVSIAVIKLVLRTNKVLADGTHPIMLRVSFNGMKERATGYSCTLRFWDKKNECVKKGYPNFVIVNSELKKQKDECIRKRDSFIASDEVYTPSMILARDEVRNVVTNDLKGLIQCYIEKKCLTSSSSVGKYNTMYRNVCNFIGRKDILVSELDEGFCRRYASWLEGKGISVGSIRGYLSVIGAICHYAISLGLMKEDDYPFRVWKYSQKYQQAKSELYIHHRSMNVMMEMFLDECIVRDGSRWSYRDGVIEKLMDIHSDLYAHYLYVIGYYCKGLAPIDISMLKRCDIKVRDINGKSYYFFNGHRVKTKKEYRFYIPQGTLESNVLIRTMLMFGNGEYFLPNLNGYSGSNSQKKVSNVYIELSNKLVDWFRAVNAEIAKRNVENKDNIETIDLECRYYSYRHSYIMSQIQKGNVNLLKLATETGKSVTTLHQYLALLNELDLV